MSLLDNLAAKLRAQPGFDPDKFDPTQIFATLSDAEAEALLADILADEERARFNRFYDLFPEDGPLSRQAYPKHMEHFTAGKLYRERCFLAANRIGKSVAGAWEVASHLTGQYRPWWEGRQFRKPVRVWAAGARNETTRDTVQKELLGEIGFANNRKIVDGSGLIPRDCIDIDGISWKQGVANLVDTVPIRHKTGGWSILGIKSYEQGRKAFEGTAKEIIWLDEEVPLDVYGECLIRLATTRGILILTFTPLQGLTEVVLQFLPGDMRPG
jgi:phage terminase large subunit-like protein